MPRYFFNIHDGASIPDAEGTELDDISKAKNEAVRLAGRLLSDNPAQFLNGEHWRLEVCNEVGLIMFTLDFLATNAPVLGESGRGRKS